MPRSPQFRRRRRSVVARRVAGRVPLGRGRPLISRYGPAESHWPTVARSTGAPTGERALPPSDVPAPPPDGAPTAAPTGAVFAPAEESESATTPLPPPTAPTAPVAPLSMRMLALAALPPTAPSPPTEPSLVQARSWAPLGATVATRTAVSSVQRAHARRSSDRRRAAFRRASQRRPTATRTPGRRRRRRRRPAAPLLAGLIVGILIAALATPIRTTIIPPSTTAALVATPGRLTGLALGDDRLPDCAPVVARLSARQRLAQRLMVGVVGDDPAATARLVHETQVGGILVGGNATALLTRQAVRGVQAGARLPLAVAVDDEGGRVQRVAALDGELPSARILAQTHDSVEVQQIARDRGRLLAARGITMNMAPDVDVSDQPRNAVIGDRSFSDDPSTVAGFAAAYAQGQHDAGVFTVLTHFPGQGHADGDPRLGRATTPPLARLSAADLTPYAELLQPGGPLADPTRTGVMVGHLDVPGLTDRLPSSLTPATYQLLRATYHFDGLVMTDDLAAVEAATEDLPLVNAVERALAAGADMALWTGADPVPPVLDALERDLDSGGLDAAADDTAVQRVLAAKGVCGRR